MKKILILLAISIICFSCKKTEAVPDNIKCLIDTEIWKSNYQNYHGIDSVKFDVYIAGDSNIYQTAYSDISGIATINIKKGVYYTIKSVSRSYKNNNGAPYHYSSTDTFLSSIQERNGNDNIIRGHLIIYYYSANSGKGSTNIPIQDPCY